MILDLVSRRIDWHRELRNVALELGNLARALLVDLIYTDDGVHGQVSPLDVFELGLDLLLRRIDNDARALAKDELLDFNKSEHFPMANLTGIDLVDLSLAHENDAVEFLFAHAYFILGVGGRVV
jgi:hypothetical protein